jgi:4'-phosphopantetheinyl transferase
VNIEIWHIDRPPRQSSPFFLQHILAHTLNIPANLVNIARGEFGKPYLVDMPECQFNLSHSNEKMVIAVGFNIDIGIDIETIKPRRNLDGLVKKCFSPIEQAHWQSLSEDQQMTLFYEFWTRKEALVKGIGRGIAIGLQNCEINVANQNDFLRLPHGDESSWHTHLFDTQQKNYCGAIAVNQNHVTFQHKNWVNYFPLIT